MASFPDNINADITPLEFELLVKEYMEAVGQNLNQFVATHNVQLSRSDGDYQIDIYAEFEALGATFKILIECKKYKGDIKREVVQLLYDKLRATGANKGLLFSTSGFQSGARKFAEEHGIALIRIIEGRYTYLTKSYGAQYYNPPASAKIPKFVGEYTRGSLTTYLQEGYFEDLQTFLINNDADY